MKKKYVAPESALLTLNFSENIAASSSIESGGTSMEGGMIIEFTQMMDGCRDFYTGSTTAVVTNPSGGFQEHFNEIFFHYPSLFQTCLRFG